MENLDTPEIIALVAIFMCIIGSRVVWVLCSKMLHSPTFLSIDNPLVSDVEVDRYETTVTGVAGIYLHTELVIIHKRTYKNGKVEYVKHKFKI